MSYEIIYHTFFNNRIIDYIISLILLVAGALIIKLLRKSVFNRLKRWADKTETATDDFLIKTAEKNILPIFYFGVFYISVMILVLPVAIRRPLHIAGIVVLTFFGVRFLSAFISFAIESYWLKRERDQAKVSSIKGILPVVKVVIWGIGATFLLDNLGFRISTVVAGLGIGGVAVALAAQAALGDLFSYFAILFDRPFEIGDFIIVDDYLGTVEHVGIKTTRIRSLSGEQLVFSNTDLTNSRVRNYKRMNKRRILFKIGVVYETPVTHIKEIPGIIRGIITDIDDTVFDRAHFVSYGDFSLDFEIVYYVAGGDYNKYMDIQQHINLALMEEFDKKGIEFAYPTQVLYLNRPAEDSTDS